MNGQLLATVEALRDRLGAVEEDVEVVTNLVHDFLRGEGSPDGPASGRGTPFEPAYPSLEAWVSEHFAPTFARSLTPTLRWCACWWDHAEAISRLEALWRTWEVARLEPLAGIATWYRNHLDPQLAALLSPTGPFMGCTGDRHAPPKPLPVALAPEGHWIGPEPNPPAARHV